MAVTRKRKKRRVAVCFGFHGKDFHGSQFQDSAYRTVEGELEKALYEIGCIRESNRGNISKIGWSRTSRTDKGVSARATCVSAKVLVDGDEAFDADGHARSIVCDLNDALPDDVRVFSVVRMSNSFNARAACTYRDYRYFVPMSVLNTEASPHAKSAPEAAEKMDRLLSRFRGTRNFANYTHRGTALKGGCRDVEMRSRIQSRMESEPHLLPRASTFNRTLYQCRVESFDSEHIELRFAGQGFLYNQIRLIVGMAVAVHMGAIPEEALDISLRNLLPRECVPLAPGFPLVAHSCAFRPQSNTLFDESHRSPTYGFKDPPMSQHEKCPPPRVLLPSECHDDVETYFRECLVPSLCAREEEQKENQGLDEVGSTFGSWNRFLRTVESASSQYSLQTPPPTDFVNASVSVAYDQRPRGLTAAICCHYDVIPGVLVKDAVQHLEASVPVESRPTTVDGYLRLIERYGLETLAAGHSIQ